MAPFSHRFPERIDISNFPEGFKGAVVARSLLGEMIHSISDEDLPELPQPLREALGAEAWTGRERPPFAEVLTAIARRAGGQEAVDQLKDMCRRSMICAQGYGRPAGVSKEEWLRTLMRANPDTRVVGATCLMDALASGRTFYVTPETINELEGVFKEYAPLVLVAPGAWLIQANAWSWFIAYHDDPKFRPPKHVEEFTGHNGLVKYWSRATNTTQTVAMDGPFHKPQLIMHSGMRVCLAPILAVALLGCPGPAHAHPDIALTPRPEKVEGRRVPRTTMPAVLFQTQRGGGFGRPAAGRADAGASRGNAAKKGTSRAEKRKRKVIEDFEEAMWTASTCAVPPEGFKYRKHPLVASVLAARFE